MANGTTVAVGKAAGKLKAAREVAAGRPGIFKKLAEEHTVVTVLAARIAASRDPKVRADLFPKFRRELLAHARGEEAELYPLLEQHDETRFLAQKARNQHIAVEMMLEDLSEIPYGAEKWHELFVWMVENVRLHVKLEENEIFPKAVQLFDAERAKELERRYEERKGEALRAM